MQLFCKKYIRICSETEKRTTWTILTKVQTVASLFVMYLFYDDLEQTKNETMARGHIHSLLHTHIQKNREPLFLLRAQ